MNSFIKWVGGKRLLRKQILQEFPTDFFYYVEIFGGAAWMLFAKDRHAEMEVYNDINRDLVNLFRCVKYHGTALQEELKWYLISREMFEAAADTYRNENLTDIQRAARFFILIKCSFGGRMQNFSAGSTSFASTIRDMERFQDRLKYTVIEQKDFEALIKLYNKENTFFYADPPYYQVEQYYQTDFSEQDHLRLHEALQSVKGRFVLTYNDCPFIRELYREYRMIPLERQSNMTAKNTKTSYREILIKNFV